MAMTLDYGLLGEDGAAKSKKHLKVLGCVVSALAAGAMLGAAISGYNSSNPAVSDMAAIGAIMSRARLGAPRTNVLRDPAFASPLAKFALTSIDVNNRMNQGGRDITLKAATNELGAGWDNVEESTKRNLLKAIEPMKYKANFLAGVSAPMGYFDPLGFSTRLSTGKLLFYREVELKHGRVAMLASLGILVGEKFHPLFGGGIDSPAAFAFQETPLQTFWPAVVAAIAIPEIFSVFSFQEPEGKGFVVTGEQWMIKKDHEPGNLGFDPLGLRPTDEKEFVELHTKEINNGRLAMIAVAGMIAQELATGKGLF